MGRSREKRQREGKKRKGIKKKSKERTGDNANSEGGLGGLRRAVRLTFSIIDLRIDTTTHTKPQGRMCGITTAKQRILGQFLFLILNQLFNLNACDVKTGSQSLI